ncbi:MAG: GAF domain-containing protein, partial [Hymenobacter sp.]
MQTTTSLPPTTLPPFTERRYVLTLIFVVSLFMLWGVGVTMGDILNKHFQEVLHVSKADSALVQLSIFGAYFIMGLPAGWFMKRFGYQKGVLLGLGLYAAGAFLMVPAANALSFGYLRLALFVLACGLAMHTGQPVITPDVLEDPLWGPFLALAERHNIRGCWSIPVRTTGGPVLGTLSMYFATPRNPSERELEMMGILSHAAAIIMARFNELQERAGFERTLRDTEARHRMELEQEVRTRTAELRDSHSQVKSVFDTTLIQLSILKAERNQQGAITDFRILLVNKELQRETGRTDLVGRLYAREYPAIVETGIFDLIVKAVETGIPQSLEYHFPMEGFDKWYSCMFVKFEDGVVASNLDITERRLADRKIKELEAQQQREIVRATFNALEDERHRFADSLHHGLGQVLYGVSMSLAKLSLKKAATDPKEYADAHLYTEKLLNQAIHDARNISHELMPMALHDHGLKVAIENICAQMSGTTKFVARFEGLTGKLEQYASLAIYRIAQELITNVSKHAHATVCTVNLEVKAGLVNLCVSDNGIGLPEDDVSAAGIGLATIRNKVKLLHGTFEAQSRAGG